MRALARANILVAMPTLINHTHKIASKTAAIPGIYLTRLEQGRQQEVRAEYEMATA